MYVVGTWFYVCCNDCVGVCGNDFCVAAVVEHSRFSIVVFMYVVRVCKECDRCCVFCVYSDVWCYRCSCMRSMSVSSYILRHQTYSSAGIMTALYVAMRVSFSLLYPVAVSAHIICSGLCACTEML